MAQTGKREGVNDALRMLNLIAGGYPRVPTGARGCTRVPTQVPTRTSPRPAACSSSLANAASISLPVLSSASE